MSEKIITIMIGLPACGKSTLSKIIKEKCESEGKTVCVLNADTYRLALLGRVNCFENEDLVWSSLYYDFIQALKDENMNHIIIDNTNLSFKRRKVYYEMIESEHGYDGITIDYRYFNISPIDCIEMQKNRERQVPDKIILNMSNALSNTNEDQKYFLNNKIDVNIRQDIIVRSKANKSYFESFSYEV